jgi:hypothetical protein
MFFMKKIALFLVALLFYSNSFSQEIGQSDQQVLQYVKYMVDRHNKPDSYGRYHADKYKYDVTYANGEIIDVIVYQDHTLSLPLKKYIDLETHFQMKNGILITITAVYNNLSRPEVSRLKKVYGHELLIKGGEYYLTDDFKGIDEVYMNTSNIPCSRYFEDNHFFIQHSSIIKDVKEKAISDKQQEEKEIEENKYINLEDIDPGVKDKISLQYLDGIERDFGNNIRYSKILQFCKELEVDPQGYWQDSSMISLRFTREHFREMKYNMHVVRGTPKLFHLLEYKFTHPKIPKPPYLKINFIEFNSLKTYATIGTFKFYVKNKAGQRTVVVLDGKKLPPSLDKELRQGILNDTTILEKDYHSMSYITCRIHNMMQTHTKVEKSDYKGQERHISEAGKGLRAVGKAIGVVALVAILLYSL